MRTKRTTRPLTRKPAERELAKSVVLIPPKLLTPFHANPRLHPRLQIERLKRAIGKTGFTNPILIDENRTILCGHGRLQAAKELGLETVPTLTIIGLSAAEKNALVIADNRLAEKAVWDFDILRKHLTELVEIDFDVELTGFSTGEIDLMLDGDQKAAEPDPEENVTGLEPAGPPLTCLGDIWILGHHRIVCGDALAKASYRQLMGSDVAQALISDPPFNVRIDGHARGRGKVRYREFAMASGEMSEQQFSKFLQAFIRLAISFSSNGSLHYIFMDWRHLPELLGAARPLYEEWKNLLVWNKTNGGQGSFYRSKHELIGVFKNGTKPHINNFGLGAEGRYRTNVLDYPGANTSNFAGGSDLHLHPTVKPIALVADLIRDCSKRNGIILDPFGGSGTAILAAERTGRVARLIELDPAYVDVTVRRWERITGGKAVHEQSRQSFAEIESQRAERPTPAVAAPTRKSLAPSERHAHG